METLQVKTEAVESILLIMKSDHAKILVGEAWLQSVSPIKDGKSIILTAKKVKTLIPADSENIVVEVGTRRYHLIGNKFFRRVA